MIIKFKFDEKYVFTFVKGEPIIGLHIHRDGKYSGPVQFMGNVEFDSFEQLYQFKEMLELSIEYKNKK